MTRIKFIILALFVLLVLGYTLGLTHGRLATWYLAEGNYYFHFVGGMLIAALAASYYATEFSKLSQPVRFFVIISMAAFIGVLWEFHEFILTSLTGYPFQGDLLDTMKDLLMDILGGMAAGLLFWRG